VTTPDRTFILSTPVQQNQWDNVRQTVVQGYLYPVHDNITGANVNVFVPADVHTPDGVDQLVEAALQPIRDTLARNPS